MKFSIIEKYALQAQDWAMAFLPKMLLALIVLYLGFKLLDKINKTVRNGIEKANISPEITSFLSNIIDVILKIAIILISVSILGVGVSSLVGIIAAAGFAVGLALQGFLGNFASGLTIVFFKPYKIGDWVQIADTFGKVTAIQIFNSTLQTPGEKTIIIPNGQVTDGIITNFSTAGRMRLELKIHMSYAESYPKIESIIKETLKEVKTILPHPEAEIGIELYDSHRIEIAVRPFIHPDNYWSATFEVNKKIKSAFHHYNIKIAYSEGIEFGTIGE